MNRAVAMVKTGDFNPRFYDYPGLYLYVQSAVVVVRFLAGATGGEWASLDQAHAPTFYLRGRAVTAARARVRAPFGLAQADGGRMVHVKIPLRFTRRVAQLVRAPP